MHLTPKQSSGLIAICNLILFDNWDCHITRFGRFSLPIPWIVTNFPSKRYKCEKLLQFYQNNNVIYCSQFTFDEKTTKCQMHYKICVSFFMSFNFSFKNKMECIFNIQKHTICEYLSFYKCMKLNARGLGIEQYIKYRAARVCINTCICRVRIGFK